MSLDLFVNFERQSNNELFYRTTAVTPYNAMIKLSSTSNIDIAQPFSSLFTAKYTINNALETLQDFDLDNGVAVSFDRRYSRMYTIQLYLSSKAQANDTEVKTMSAIFVDKFPVATFVAYPSSYFDESTGEQRFCNSSNYVRSPGVYFYGEGHTETICLSASGVSSIGANNNINWLIGNDTTRSQWNVISNSPTTATVRISSTLAQNIKIPIHVRITNDIIGLNGPICYYDDVTGEKKYYPFFSSSLTPLGSEQTLNKFQQSIHVKPYPQTTNYALEPAFAANVTDIPYDYSTKWFDTKLVDLQNRSLIAYSLSSTIWSLQANVDGLSRASNWSYSTKPLLNISGYRFPLSYTTAATENIPYLKISSVGDTTVTNIVSAAKKVQIQKFPYDWKPSTQIETYEVSTLIVHQPYVKVYATSYFAIKNGICQFEKIQAFSKDFLELQKVTILSDSTSSLTLTGNNLAKPFNLTFTTLGKQSLSAVSLFLNTKTGTTNKVVNVFDNVTDVVNSYDDQPIAEYYHTTNSKLAVSQLSAAILSPNEWVVADNINSIFEATYKVLDTILAHTVLYTNNSYFYSWLGSSNYRWVDLECKSGNTDKLTWTDQLPNKFQTNSNGYPLYWNQQTCDDSVESDNVCLQKYCLEWKWSSRTRANSITPTTWYDTKQTSAFAKKWTFEPCGLDSPTLMCDLGKWHVSSIDPEYFPIPTCGYNAECFNVACIEIGKYLLIAKKTELNLITTDYTPKKLHRAGLADSLYAFASIEGVALDGNRIYVLDSLIPKISIYEISNDKLTLMDSWGRFGFASNAYGFNRPKDITIDQNKYLYITDTGNKCIKKYTLAGKYVATFTHTSFNSDAPVSCCIDSQKNIHVLLDHKVVILNESGSYITEYLLSKDIVAPKKITSSYNRETVYVSHQYGVHKYFRTGVLFEPLINKLVCSNGSFAEHFTSIHPTVTRDLYICVNDKVLKYSDRMKLATIKSPISKNLYWSLDQIKIHKDEYVQTWVYLKSFHRLWDNIELIRNALHYKDATHPEQKIYESPTYSKSDLTIGQNEIVTNSVINRLSQQLWRNIQSLLNYFN